MSNNIHQHQYTNSQRISTHSNDSPASESDRLLMHNVQPETTKSAANITEAQKVKIIKQLTQDELRAAYNFSHQHQCKNNSIYINSINIDRNLHKDPNKQEIEKGLTKEAFLESIRIILRSNLKIKLPKNSQERIKIIISDYDQTLQHRRLEKKDNGTHLNFKNLKLTPLGKYLVEKFDKKAQNINNKPSLAVILSANSTWPEQKNALEYMFDGFIGFKSDGMLWSSPLSRDNIFLGNNFSGENKSKAKWNNMSLMTFINYITRGNGGIVFKQTICNLIVDLVKEKLEKAGLKNKIAIYIIDDNANQANGMVSSLIERNDIDAIYYLDPASFKYDALHQPNATIITRVYNNLQDETWHRGEKGIYALANMTADFIDEIFGFD